VAASPALRAARAAGPSPCTNRRQGAGPTVTSSHVICGKATDGTRDQSYTQEGCKFAFNSSLLDRLPKGGHSAEHVSTSLARVAEVWAARRNFTNNLELPKFLNKSSARTTFQLRPDSVRVTKLRRFLSGDSRSSAFQNFKTLNVELRASEVSRRKFSFSSEVPRRCPFSF
jgi:hypothetical protein